MSKLEVREIGPISGETEVRLADGATAVGFGGGEGSIIQTVFFESEDLLSATGAEGWPNYTVFPGFEVSITPKKSDSTLIVTFSGAYVHTQSLASALNILRTGSGVSDKFLHIPENIVAIPTIGSTNVGLGFLATIVGYDKPNTTQAVKYLLTSTVINGNGGSIAYLNKTQEYAGTSYGQSVSRLIVQEVSA